MHLLLPLAALASLGTPVAPAAWNGDYTCQFIQPSAAGELLGSARVDSAGQPGFRSLTWRSSTFSPVAMLGTWSAEYAGTGSITGSISINYHAEGYARGKLRIRIGKVLPGGAVQVLAASDPLRPGLRGLIEFDLEWDVFRDLVRGTSLLEIAVIDPDGKMVASRALAGNGFDFVDSQLAPTLAVLNAMAADYRNKCDSSGSQITT